VVRIIMHDLQCWNVEHSCAYKQSIKNRALRSLVENRTIMASVKMWSLSLLSLVRIRVLDVYVDKNMFNNCPYRCHFKHEVFDSLPLEGHGQPTFHLQRLRCCPTHLCTPLLLLQDGVQDHLVGRNLETYKFFIIA